MGRTAVRPYTKNLAQPPLATPSKACGSDRADEAQTEPWALAHGPYFQVICRQLSAAHRHQAFEFFKPVEDNVDLVLLSLLFLDHQESLPIG